MNNDYNYHNDSNSLEAQERQAQLQSRSAVYLAKVMGWMCLGLLTTVVSSLLCLGLRPLRALVFGSGFGVIGVCIVQIVLVLALSAGLSKMSPAVATVMFMLYAAVTGLTMSVFMVVYTLDSLVLAFGVAAVVFLAMSLYGLITRRDLSSWGSLLLFGLFGIILAGVVNMFWSNAMLDFVITAVGIVIFIGLTAYDTQKIKAIYQSALAEGYNDEDAEVRKLAIYGALSLYLDFINLFLKLLRLLGRRRN